MTWATRTFKWLATSSRELSAKDLELRYEVPHARRTLAELLKQGCIEEAFRLGRERFWRVKPNAPPPVDRRIDAARKKVHIAVRARQLKARRLARA